MFRINSEADRLLKSLLQYASRKREAGVFDMTEILGSFYQERLNDETLTGNGNGLAKRFRNLVKEYVESDPRRQGRMDIYLGSGEKN